MRVAAIDVGTNTTRLLVAAVNATGYRELVRRLTFTRLGEGVDATGRLRPEAIQRTLNTIADYCSECGELDVSVIRIAATSAVREALNRGEFLSAATELVGRPVEVLSGEEEARLSFLGATFDLGPGSYLVCDIGGGSTEFVVGSLSDQPDLHAVSLDLGVVRLTERFIRSDPVEAAESMALESAIDGTLLGAHMPPTSESTRFVGVAGTITSLAAIKLGLSSYDPARTHGAVLSLDDVVRLYRLLSGMTITERMKFSSLPEGRADVIVAGAAILYRAMLRWSFETVLVSEKDILDGMVLDVTKDGAR